MNSGELRFTARQRQIVRLIAEGLTAREIGERTGLAARTAKHHADVLREKLGVERRRDVPAAYYEATGTYPWPRD